MADPYFSDLLGDPLSDITRKERRNLLFASTVGCAIVSMDMVPTKLSALGIDFSSPAQSSFLILVAVVIAYFFFAFVTCGLADFLSGEANTKNISLRWKENLKIGLLTTSLSTMNTIETFLVLIGYITGIRQLQSRGSHLNFLFP